MRNIAKLLSREDVEKFSYAEELLKIKLHGGNTVLFRPNLRNGREDASGYRASHRIACIGKIMKVHAYEGMCEIRLVTAEPVTRRNGAPGKPRAGLLNFSFKELQKAGLEQFHTTDNETFEAAVHRARDGFRRAAAIVMDQTADILLQKKVA